MFQGFPIAALYSRKDLLPDFEDSVHNSCMHDIAGNMVTLPVLLSVVLATFASVNWRRAGEEESTQDDVQQALGAFALVQATAKGDGAAASGHVPGPDPAVRRLRVQMKRPRS